MSKMRAKMHITKAERFGAEQQDITLAAVCRDGVYPDDGSDENNTYAAFTPTADLQMTIQNPALVGTFEVGQVYYVDFTAVDQGA